VAGKMATTSKIGCVPRKNSYGVTRNCEVPRNKQDALNGVAQTWTGLSISTKDLSNISSGPIICLTNSKAVEGCEFIHYFADENQWTDWGMSWESRAFTNASR
jgi:hypothetical protein